MSDKTREPKAKKPVTAPAADDPWAKWRQPEAAAPATARREAPAVDAQKKVELPASAPVEPPSGTLRVLKSGDAPRSEGRKPLRKSELNSNKHRARPSAPEAECVPAAAPVRKARPPVSRPVEREERPVAAAPSGVRLSKVMSERAMCSRREADLWIERGWVFVNGERVAELGTRIDPQAEITISKEAQHDQAKQVTILLHKPVGYVSSQPEPGFTPAVTLVTAENWVRQSGDPEFKPWMMRGLAPAGRLDVDSTGLLVLTQDGRVAKKLIGEESDAEKEYLVRVAGEMIPGGLRLLQFGLELDGKPLKKAWVKQLNEDQLHFILKEGKKRQIRRMCELVGLRVIGLKRVRIGRIKLGDLPLGHWRFLRPDESF